jgi:high-affinity iron transporter
LKVSFNFRWVVKMVLQSLLVTFREGIESFLVIGVIAAYLRKTDRAGLLPGVRLGIALSVVTCVAGAWLWLQVPNQPMYEGIAALVTALFVAPVLWHAMRAGRGLKRAIEQRVDAAAPARAGVGTPGALLGVAVVTALFVTREGLEAVFYLGVQVMASRAAPEAGRAWPVVAGAAAGLVAAAAVAIGWARLSRRLNLFVVVKVTALFLLLFLGQLVVYGVHELAESGVIHGSQAFHDATEVFGPDGPVGHLISYSLLAAPLAYVALARRAARRAVDERKALTPAA